MEEESLKSVSRAELEAVLRRALDARVITRGVTFRLIPVPNRKPPNWTADWQGSPSAAQVKEAELVLAELQECFRLRG
jgi:hypothetical protein